VTAKLPDYVPYGQKIKGSIAVRVTNIGDFAYSGLTPVSVRLSAGDVPTTADPEVARIFKSLKLKPGHGKTVKVKLSTLPAVPDGQYHLSVILDPENAISEKAEDNNAIEDAALHHVAPPVVDVGGTYRSTPGTLLAGKKEKLSLSLGNSGNIALVATVNVRVVATTDASGAGGTELGVIPVRLKIKAASTKSYNLKFFVPPDMAAGSYFLVTTLDSTNALVETDELNNTLMAGPLLL